MGAGDDPYADLAAEYHWLYDPFTERVGTRAPGVQATIRGLPAGARVLDAACGIGVDAASLHRRGFRVTATDASTAMVERCRERLAHEAPGVEVDTCGWADLPARFEPEFDAVLCLGNSLSHAPTSSARRAALTGFAAVLQPGGLLLADLQDWAAVHDRGSGADDDPLVVSRDGVECRRSYDWRVPDRFGDPMVLEITLHVREAGHERRSRHAVTFQPFTRETLLADLEATGYVDVEVWQVPGDDRYAVIARRPVVTRSG